MQITRKFILGVLSLVLALGITSCTEKEEVGEYDNWQSRNTVYVDSIAKVCDRNADGNWERICAFNLDATAEAAAPNNQHYVYVHKMEKGSGDYCPQYNDSIRAHYMGRLIPSASHSDGYIFDKSYSTYTFNEKTDVPSLFGVAANSIAGSGLIVGFSTALMHMKVGDHWLIYIPAYLGYGSKGSGNDIPAYSTLIFDVKLAKVYKYQIDFDTSWH